MFASHVAILDLSNIAYILCDRVGDRPDLKTA